MTHCVLSLLLLRRPQNTGTSDRIIFSKYAQGCPTCLNRTRRYCQLYQEFFRSPEQVDRVCCEPPTESRDRNLSENIAPEFIMPRSLTSSIGTTLTTLSTSSMDDRARDHSSGGKPFRRLSTGRRASCDRLWVTCRPSTAYSSTEPESTS